jgi:dihydrofolate reductase
MIISLLLAASENNVIGKDNDLPWNLPNDLKFFKNITWGMPLIMGRKTFESFKKALKGRTNIVITRQGNWHNECVTVVKDLEEAWQEAAKTDCKEVFVIGGGEIFKQTFALANKIYITRVHSKVEGDVFFPEIKTAEWNLVSERHMFKDEQHEYDYTFQLWQRKAENGNQQPTN